MRLPISPKDEILPVKLIFLIANGTRGVYLLTTKLFTLFYYLLGTLAIGTERYFENLNCVFPEINNLSVVVLCPIIPILTV